MSDYSSNFPTQSPTFAFDAKAGKLDSRISFSRADTPPTYSAPSGVHYWSNEKHLSSENLVPYSNLSSGFSFGRTTLASTNNSAPDGGSDAASILETAVSGSHEVYDTFASVSGQQYSFVFYLKANGRTKVIFKPQATSVIAEVTFDLTAVTSTVTSGSADSHSITAIGSTGWYKCAATVTATATGTGYTQFNLVDGTGASTYTGDVTKGVFAWGASVSSTGETVLNETSGSIHREFAPTLKSVTTSGQPRFEFDPADGQSVGSGTALGLLVESQATNLTKYSDDFSSWGDTSTVVVTPNAGVAPSGQLEADLLVSPSTAATHYILDSTIAFTSGTTYTASVYVKSAGHRYVQLCGNSAAFSGPYQWVNYDLEAGTLNANNCSGTISSVGNGYYRITATMTASSTQTRSFILVFADSLSSGFFPTTTGDDFSGFLAHGFQTEVGSASSSLISTNGSQVSRASDSCSVVDATLFDNGGGTLYAEVTPNNLGSTFSGIASINAGGLSDRVEMVFNNTAARATVVADGTTYSTQSGGSYTAGAEIKSCLTYANDSVSYYVNGSEIGTTDTSAVMPVVNSLSIGNTATGSWPLNGNIKRVAVYSDSVSETAASALTS